MSYHQVHIDERLSIERLYNSGHSAGKIARMIYRSRSTILREIKRNGYEGRDGKWYYHAKVAQALYKRRQKKADRRQWLTHGPDKRDADWRNGYIYKNYPHRYKRKRSKYKSGKNISRNLGSSLLWWECKRGRWWREHYNRYDRVRYYKWEEFWRTDTKTDRHLFRRDYSDRFVFTFQLVGKRASKKRRKKYRWWWYDKYRKRIRESRWHNPFRGGFFPHPDSNEIFEQHSPHLKPQRRHTSPPFPAGYFTLPFVSQQPEGRTMSVSQENSGIFKIPTIFEQGSPRFLLKSA